MFLIEFMGKYTDEEILKKNSILPENAVMLNEGDNINLAGFKGFLVILPIISIMAYITFKRIEKMDGILKMDIKFALTFILMLIIIVILMYLHEFIHAIIYPIKSEKQIWNSNFGQFVYCNSEISKVRFIIVSIVPMIVLGIIPYIYWMNFLSDKKTVFSVCFLLISIFMTLISSGDVYNIFNVMRQVPKNATVLNYGLHTYFIVKK
jgi:hypothetical protein